MMKIFSGGKSSWDSKVNFVDANDVYVGYDMWQGCCEHAGWFVADKVMNILPDDTQLEDEESLDGFVFDPNFFEHVGHMQYPDSSGYNALDNGGCAVFRMVNGEHEKYLHLFNCHNGYYGHGFEVKHGGEVVRADSL